MSEGFIELARRRGASLGILRWLFVAVKGHLGKFVLYRILLPRCDHVFVQSEWMASDLARRGIERTRMTAVPMAVDLARLHGAARVPVRLCHELSGKRVIACLGTLDRTRRVDFLFEVLAAVRQQVANVCLLLIGDTQEEADRIWLKAEAERHQVSDAVVWTGWLAPETAWEYLRHAEVAVSVLPRGELFDGASPTKLVEYLALGLPVVANDQPDQHAVLAESGAGLSVVMNASAFATAIQRILEDGELAAAMSRAGPAFVGRQRSYTVLADRVADVYRRLMP